MLGTELHKKRNDRLPPINNKQNKNPIIHKNKNKFRHFYKSE